MLAGRECKEGAVQIDASHLGADFVLKNFPGMCSRCAQFGYDLARKPVPVSPSAHFVMGGARIDKDAKALSLTDFLLPAKTLVGTMVPTGWVAMVFVNQVFMAGRPARHWHSL